ncbi:MAG: hypothetical protein L6R42_003613 [Xanthoria sp. 1 TBL-2021]|nr:MAG: hypothetical protein L6R42_003613 [Xanthoria sp. 1 TBL-2021]
MELALRGLKDHSDQQIHDAIVQEEWRHALQMIEKREKKLKKGQINDWLTACKASVLLMLPEPVKRRQGRVLLDSLYSKNPPVVDFNAAETLQSFAELRHESDPRMDTLWMQAANAQPTDEQLHKHWFLSRFRMRDWQGARKAGMTYTKHFPNKRDPFFWTIFANFMASRTLPDENSEKQLCGTMAYRMCAKAAEAVVLDQDQELRNGRVIRTLDDIVFLLDVYESQKKYEEALELLESDRTGIGSKIGRRSWKLVTSKIRLLGSAHRWLDQFKFCFELLEDASPVNDKPQVHGFGKLGNDGYVWTALVNAALSLKVSSWMTDRAATDAETSETAVREAIDRNFYKNTRLAVASLLDGYKMDRNAMCAGMFWANNLERDVRGENLATKTFEYFETYGHKTFCFNDLQPYVGAMQPPVMQCFLHKVRAWLMGRGYGFSHLNQDKPFDPNMLMAKTNALKLEYCLIYSRDKKPDEVIEETNIETFVVECIKYYNFALENSENNARKPREFAERFPGDDAGLLAAAALLKFCRRAQNDKKLRAMILLDELITRSPAMYEVFGTLILLYVQTGAGSLAARTYHGLSIKNIQLPTLSWLLWTRLSTVHPHRLQSKDFTLPNDLRASRGEADPVQHLMQALDYHMHLRETDQQEILEFLEAKQYASLHRAIANSLQNRNGFVKYLLFTEWARTERVSGLQQKRDYRNLFDPPADTYDNRDESSVPHWEHPDSMPLLLEVMPGQWPTDEWLSHQMSIAHTFDHVTNGDGSKQKSNVYPNPTAYSEPEKSMTREEHSQYQTAVECQSLLNLFESKGAEEAARTAASWSVSASLESIERRLQAVNDELATIRKQENRYFWVISDEVIAPSWLFFHVSYTNLDTAILIKKTLDTVETANRKHRILDLQSASEKITRIRKLCDKLRGIIHDVAVKLYDEFSSDRHHEPMVHSIIGRPSDPCEKDPIAYWLRDHFDRGTGNADKVAKAYVTRLCQAWCEALRNLCKLTAPS